jgi:hypothetical protein
MQKMGWCKMKKKIIHFEGSKIFFTDNHINTPIVLVEALGNGFYMLYVTNFVWEEFIFDAEKMAHVLRGYEEIGDL